MRLYLLPISTRRTLIYCERASKATPTGKLSLVDKAINKANTTWADWEKSDAWWKKRTTEYGNIAFRRIPFEEWGLKSIPPMHKAQLADAAEAEAQSTDTSSSAVSDRRAQGRAEVLYPKLYQGLCKETPLEVLRRLGTERQGLHRSKMVWSIVAMPLTIPFIAIPIIPNIPFFYLVFRAWSHWKAWSGAKHLAHLVANDRLKFAPSPIMDSLYTAGLIHPNREAARNAFQEPPPEQTKQVVEVVRHQTHDGGEDVMLLQGWNSKLLAERFAQPELEVEVERAVEQVEQSLGKESAERSQEKKEVEEKIKRGAEDIAQKQK